MKLAGVAADDPALTRARACIRARADRPRPTSSRRSRWPCSASTRGAGMPGDAGRDHAPSPLVVLQRLGDLLLVADGPGAAPGPDGPPPVHPLPRERRIDELWPVRATPRRPLPTRAAASRASWKNVFIAVDGFVKAWERLGPRPWRARAVRAAPRLARAAAVGARRPGRDLPGDGQCGARAPRSSATRTTTG